MTTTTTKFHLAAKQRNPTHLFFVIVFFVFVVDIPVVAEPEVVAYEPLLHAGPGRKFIKFHHEGKPRARYLTDPCDEARKIQPNYVKTIYIYEYIYFISSKGTAILQTDRPIKSVIDLTYLRLINNELLLLVDEGSRRKVYSFTPADMEESYVPPKLKPPWRFECPANSGRKCGSSETKDLEGVRVMAFCPLPKLKDFQACHVKNEAFDRKGVDLNYVHNLYPNFTCEKILSDHSNVELMSRALVFGKKHIFMWKLNFIKFPMKLHKTFVKVEIPGIEGKEIVDAIIPESSRGEILLLVKFSASDFRLLLLQENPIADVYLEFRLLNSWSLERGKEEPKSIHELRNFGSRILILGLSDGVWEVNLDETLSTSKKKKPYLSRIIKLPGKEKPKRLSIDSDETGQILAIGRDKEDKIMGLWFARDEISIWFVTLDSRDIISWLTNVPETNQTLKSVQTAVMIFQRPQSYYDIPLVSFVFPIGDCISKANNMSTTKQCVPATSWEHLSLLDFIPNSKKKGCVTHKIVTSNFTTSSNLVFRDISQTIRIVVGITYSVGEHNQLDVKLSSCDEATTTALQFSASSNATLTAFGDLRQLVTLTFSHHLNESRPWCPWQNHGLSHMTFIKLSSIHSSLSCFWPSRRILKLSSGCSEKKIIFKRIMPFYDSRERTFTGCKSLENHKFEITRIQGSKTKSKKKFYDLKTYGCPDIMWGLNEEGYVPILTDENGKPLDVDFFLYEETGRQNHLKYSQTIQDAKCYNEPQSWKKMKEKYLKTCLAKTTDPRCDKWAIDFAWTRHNYVHCNSTIVKERKPYHCAAASCSDCEDCESNALNHGTDAEKALEKCYKKCPQCRHYEVLNPTKENRLLMAGLVDAVYLFQLVILEKNYSYCDIRLRFGFVAAKTDVPGPDDRIQLMPLVPSLILSVVFFFITVFAFVHLKKKEDKQVAIMKEMEVYREVDLNDLYSICDDLGLQVNEDEKNKKRKTKMMKPTGNRSELLRVAVRLNDEDSHRRWESRTNISTERALSNKKL